MLKQRLKTALGWFGEAFFAPSVKQTLLRREVAAIHRSLRLKTPTNPALNGYKVFSQTDEDGIISEIFRRVGESNRFFIEFGCGNGTENNTHLLLLKGWHGGWVDGNTRLIDQIVASIPLQSKRLWVRNEFINLENACPLIAEFVSRAGISEIDFLSLDIDGNDLHVTTQIMARYKPRVMSIEYNGKFPPPLALSIAYDPAHAWSKDDYHGASLQAFVDALPDYTLVACSISGANAFFVRQDLARPFDTYPIADLYQPARHHLIHLRAGPPASLKYLRDLVRNS